MTINLRPGTAYPVLTHAGPVTISWQGIFTAFALALAICFPVRSAERLGIPANRSR